MDTPIPVDVNRLKGILGASLAVMNKVETGNFKEGNIDPRALTEEGVQQLQAEGVQRPAVAQAPQGYTAETVRNSNLPPEIKKLMIERPIQQLSGPNHSFTLQDVMGEADEKPMGLPKAKARPQQITETRATNSDMITISKAELDAMINERLLEFFAKSYNKMLTEQTVKQTVKILTAEGRMTTKKKIG